VDHEKYVAETEKESIALQSKLDEAVSEIQATASTNNKEISESQSREQALHAQLKDSATQLQTIAATHEKQMASSRSAEQSLQATVDELTAKLESAVNKLEAARHNTPKTLTRCNCSLTISLRN
jgi:chromosome segregation ATPase